jgi:hypothetical protein
MQPCSQTKLRLWLRFHEFTGEREAVSARKWSVRSDCRGNRKEFSQFQEILWRTAIRRVGVLLTKNVKELPQKWGFRGF